MKYTIALALLFISTAIFAQEIPVGNWRTHLTYHNAQNVAVAGNKIYCASENGLFYLDKADNNLQTLTTIDGLSDIGIADLAYTTTQNTLVIGYENGNIDLIREDEIINIRTLLNSTRSNKGINSIQILGNLAIFSTNFGGVELDLNSLTIKDFYENIGGTASQGFSTAATVDSLYLSTNLGIYGVSLASNVNKQDFNNWNLISGTAQARQVANLNGKLYYSISGDGLYLYENGQSQALSIGAGETHNRLVATQSALYLCTPSKVYQISPDNSFFVLSDLAIVQPQAVALDGLQIWLADSESGLVKYNATGSENFFPSGTFSQASFRMFSFQGKILAVAGGFNANLQAENKAASFYIFENGTWQNFTSATNSIEATAIPTLSDLTSFAFDAANNTAYLGAFGNGVLKFDLATNTFESIASSPTRVTGLAIDNANDLWATSSTGQVFRLQAGSWQSEETANSPVEIRIDEFGNKWVRQNSGGVVVFDNNGQKRTIFHSAGAGNLRGSRATSIDIDLNGSVWIGTDDGITEFFDPFSIFNGADGTFVRDIDGNVVLKDAVVTAIATDGGNRKWLGTRNNGVFLYDDNGELVGNFNTENSPLLSNEINSISIQPNTGEVFFATPQGIISYRGTATTGKGAFQANIFPNPVRPEFSGLVSISGLKTNSEVRITDTAGNLVFKTQAEGGTATWNASNFNGQRVQTGIYFIFSTDEDGEESLVGKVAVVQ